jgi:hypothetical protein
MSTNPQRNFGRPRLSQTELRFTLSAPAGIMARAFAPRGQLSIQLAQTQVALSQSRDEGEGMRDESVALQAEGFK